MDGKQEEGKKSLTNMVSIVTSKRSRSFIFLIVTFVLILFVNGLLPTISGQAHYTADTIEVTYDQYKQMKQQNKLYDLTYSSKLSIVVYKELYIIKNPDLSPEELVLIEPPDDLKVSIYTKFFFESPWWYFDAGLALVSAIFLFYAVFNFLIVRAKDTRLEHVDGENALKQLNEKYLDPDTFEPWMERDFNRERKIKQHIRNMKYELKKLETKTPYIVRRRFKNYVSLEQAESPNNLLPVVYNKLTKQERRYIDKKDEILSKLEEAYIKESVVDTTVPHFKEIKPGFVYSGINYDGVGQDEYSTIRTDQQRIRSSMFSKVLVSLATTLSFASIITVVSVNVNSQAPLWVLITIVMRIVPLFLQIYFAIDYNNWFMENQLLPNLKFRQNIAYLYLAEMKRRGTLVEPVVINKISINKKGEYI